jgi:hypothetical protein
MGKIKGVIMRILLIASIFLSGCADPYRAMYEGVRNRNEATRSPSERAVKPIPGYDEYQRERKNQAD